jgi:uncharacterized membrane protein
MAFCANCGAAVEGRFCAKCGTSVDPEASAPPGAQPYSAGSQVGGLADNVAGALCYLLLLITGILFLVLEPYKRNQFVRFHAFQAIFLHLAWIALAIADSIIGMILPWSLAVLTSLIWLVIFLGGMAVWIFCMVKAYNRERFKLPIIGDLAEKQV